MHPDWLIFLTFEAPKSGSAPLEPAANSYCLSGFVIVVLPSTSISPLSAYSALHSTNAIACI